jgi:hypothetical protein
VQAAHINATTVVGVVLSIASICFLSRPWSAAQGDFRGIKRLPMDTEYIETARYLMRYNTVDTEAE